MPSGQRRPNAHPQLPLTDSGSTVSVVVDDGEREGVTDWEGVFEGVWLGVGVGVRAMEGVWEREAPKLGLALGVGVKEGVRQKPYRGWQPAPQKEG